MVALFSLLCPVLPLDELEGEELDDPWLGHRREGRWLEWIVEVGLIICTNIKGFSEHTTMEYSKLF